MALVLDTESNTPYHFSSILVSTNQCTLIDSQYTYNMDRTFIDIRRIKITNITLPVSYYTTNFTFSINGTPITIAGSYNATTLAALMQTQMNAILAGFTVSISPTTYLITITNATPFGAVFGTNPIGIVPQTFVGVTSIVGTLAVSLNGPTSIWLKSPELLSAYSNTFNQKSYSKVVCEIPITQPPGFIVRHNPKKNLDYKHQNIQAFSFWFVDSADQILNFNGGEITLTLQCWSTNVNH
jgi:hypothetical protein